MLSEFLEQKRTIILKRWTDQTFNTYDPGMVRFLKNEKNQFANPIRNTIVTCLEKLYESLLKGIGVNEYKELEDLIKVRAVQDFSPSNALSFIFDLKKIVREELENDNQMEKMVKELFVFEEKVDTLLGLAFDLYTQSRDKIHEIKLTQSRGMYKDFRKRK